MASLWLQASVICFLLAPALALDSDFTGLYPDTSLSCLNDASARTTCNGSPSVQQLNKCLCGNDGDFITNTAQCLGKEQPGDVESVYKSLSQNCADSDTPMTVSQSEFYDAADGKKDSPSSTASSTPSSTATDTPDDDSKEEEASGLSTGAIIGIAVGAGVLGVAAIAALVFLLRRKRRRSDESHPMLPQHNSVFGSPTTFPPTEPSSGFENETKAVWTTDGRSASHTSGRTPSPNPSPMTGWGSPQEAWSAKNGHQYTDEANGWASPKSTRLTAPYASYAPPPEIVVQHSHHDGTPGTNHVFEMDGTATANSPGRAGAHGGYQGRDAAVEMP